MKPQILIHHFLEKNALLHPNKEALVHENNRVSYAFLNEKANQLADFLVGLKDEKGQKVIILLENSLEYVISYYAVLKSGNTVVSLSTDLKPEGLSVLLERVDPFVIISSRKYEDLLQKSRLRNKCLKSILIVSPQLEWRSLDGICVTDWTDAVSPGILQNPGLLIDEHSIASIIFTSGSTGDAKGVLLSHHNIVSNTYSIVEYLSLSSGDVQMAVLPFFYVMGKSLLNTHFCAGGKVVINNKFAFPASVIQQMAEEGVTGFSGVPSSYAYLVHRSPLIKYKDRLPKLRYCSQAGGHMSETIKRELRKILPEHTQIYIMYGATEASARLTFLEPEHFEYKMNSIGKPIPGVSISVMDIDGNALPPGEIGELVAQGDNIMKGYFNDEDATGKVLDEKGYHTGDMGYRDLEGFFYLIGRKDNLLKVGGHRINPQEIEDAILSTGLVMECIVFGVPDPLLGNKLIAVAAAGNDKEIDENMILGDLAMRLPKYKMPSVFKKVRSLPKKANGKIDSLKCRELV